MLKKILIGIAAVLAVILLIAALKPAEMTVTRELAISASPEKLFPYINNSRKSYEWMPWSEGDSDIKIEYSGPAEGLGAKSSWEGKQMGVGNSEVVESITNQIVKTKLSYTEPFAMSQLAEISLLPTNGGTVVKWSVSGQNNFFFRLMGIFVDCDKMIGGEFEKGLKKLKTLAENN
jgi:uncharacterized protein YndB with AHSA1/START domain